ncbi:unnamed protein product [Nezara viridula]|uniref:Uncharacterized protein n=1 Tax=Nezara viridula TaxID=85310 RepID=A0A9P0MVM9_NEZVI|nr:unnamed protein product [Nezara viridula]
MDPWFHRSKPPSNTFYEDSLSRPNLLLSLTRFPGFRLCSSVAAGFSLTRDPLISLGDAQGGPLSAAHVTAHNG